LFRRVASGIDVDCRSVARLYKVKKSVNCREYVRSDGTERDKDDEAARGSNTFFTFLSRNQARQRGRPLFGKPTLVLVTTAPAFCFWLLSPAPAQPATLPRNRTMRSRVRKTAFIAPCRPDAVCVPELTESGAVPPAPRPPSSSRRDRHVSDDRKKVVSVCESSSSRNAQADGRSATTHHTKRRSFTKRS
jgi:hypothetical protein